MPLLTYEEARPWAKAIRDEVLERRMPPWGAVKGFGEFRYDPSLSETDIETIANWVEGGAPNGEEAYLPAPPMLSQQNWTPPPAEKMSLQDGLTLDRDLAALGIEPAGPMRAIAHKPDGTIEPLIWLRLFRKGQPEAYYFRKQVKLPKGTKIQMDGAAAFLLTCKGEACLGLTSGLKPAQ